MADDGSFPMTSGDPGNVDQQMQMQTLINQMGGASANPEKAAALQKQMLLAQSLRNGPNMPHGTYIPGHIGGVYVAPNALQSLGAGAQFGLGAMAGQNAIDKEQNMAAQEAKNRTDVMKLLASQNLQPPMASPDMASYRDNLQNPAADYNFLLSNGSGAGPRNTNMQPAPRQMTPDEFAALAQ